MSWVRQEDIQQQLNSTERRRVCRVYLTLNQKIGIANIALPPSVTKGNQSQWKHSQLIKLNNMIDKLELKSSHKVIDTVNVADVESIFYCKPTDPDFLTVLMKDGKRLYCDEVCPVDSLQEEPVIQNVITEPVGVPAGVVELANIPDKKSPTNGEIGDYDHTAVLEGLGYQSKEEPVSEDLEEFALQYAGHHAPYDSCMQEVEDAIKAGAEWQKEKIINNATKVTVHIDTGNYPYIPQIELYDYDKDMPLAKEGDKYKVILIKED